MAPNPRTKFCEPIAAWRTPVPAKSISNGRGRILAVASRHEHATARQRVFLAQARNEPGPFHRRQHRHVGDCRRVAGHAGRIRCQPGNGLLAVCPDHVWFRCGKFPYGTCRRPLGHHTRARRFRAFSLLRIRALRLGIVHPADRDSPHDSRRRCGGELCTADRGCLAMVSPPTRHRSGRCRKRQLSCRDRLATVHRGDNDRSRMARCLSRIGRPGHSGPVARVNASAQTH